MTDGKYGIEETRKVLRALGGNFLALIAIDWGKVQLECDELSTAEKASLFVEAAEVIISYIVLPKAGKNVALFLFKLIKG